MTTNHPVPTPPPAEPAASLRPVESQATVDLIYEMAEAIEDADSCRQERIYYVTLARGALGPVADRLAAADRENAELRGEVERLRPMVEDTEGVILRKQEDVDEIATQLAAAQAQLAEAQQSRAGSMLPYRRAVTRAESAEARLEAVRVLRSRWKAERTYLNAEQEPIAAAYIELLDAALSAAPQPEPERPWSDLSGVEDDDATPASDEPARCEHDFHAINLAGERIGWRLAGAGSSERCPAASGTPDGGQR